ncbi:MAG: hypothetical protein ACOC1L_08140, partial [Bacillota bacterium]
MIRKLTEADRQDVLTFLSKEPEINMYIIGDIKNFGFDQEDQAIYAEFKDNTYYAVMARNLSHIVYYARDNNFNSAWLDVFNQFDYLFISGKASLMERINPLIHDMRPDRLMFMKSTTFTKDDSVDYTGIEILQTEADA